MIQNKEGGTQTPIRHPIDFHHQDFQERFYIKSKSLPFTMAQKTLIPRYFEHHELLDKAK